MLALLLLNLLFAGARTAVEQVFPSGPLLPVNCLRISIYFGEEQSTDILRRLVLRDSEGRICEHPFVEQELWSPDRRSLTLLFDPGRVKQGLGAHDLLGSPLAAKSSVSLFLDGALIKEWRIRDKPCESMQTTGWRVEAPRPNTLSRLRLIFPDPVDHQGEHLLALIDSFGNRVAGAEELTGFETQWVFQPKTPWAPGRYRIVVHPDFENPCGDRMGGDFEAFVQPAVTKGSAIAFEIGTAK